MQGSMEQTTNLLQVQKLKVYGVSYRSQTTHFFMNKKEKILEYRLFDLQGNLAYKFVIHQKDVNKVKISPNSIIIDFKTLRILEAGKQNYWKNKAILHNRWISCRIKLTEEELLANINKIAQIKERKGKLRQNAAPRETASDDF